MLTTAHQWSTSYPLHAKYVQSIFPLACNPTSSPYNLYFLPVELTPEICAASRTNEPANHTSWTLKMLPPALHVVLTPISRTSCSRFFWQTDVTSDFLCYSYCTCSYNQYIIQQIHFGYTSDIFNCYMSQQWDAILRKLLQQRCTRCILVGQFVHLCCNNSMIVTVLKHAGICHVLYHRVHLLANIVIHSWYFPKSIFDKHKVVPANTMMAYRVKSHSFLPSPPDRASGKLHNLAA